MKIVFLLFTFTALCLSVSAQASKPWGEWSKKDAEKVLNDSSWGQTFTELPKDSGSAAAVTNTRGGMGGDRQIESGQPKVGKAIHYRGRLLTAKPVREAFARMVTLAQPDATAELKTQLQGFVDRDFGDFLVISFSLESEDPRVMKMGEINLSKLNKEVLKDKVYLERKDGKRATFIDYKPPVGDGMGGKFIFSKTLDGQPFLDESAEFAKFYVQLSEKEKISLKYKVAGMNYGGKLEY